MTDWKAQVRANRRAARQQNRARTDALKAKTAHAPSTPVTDLDLRSAFAIWARVEVDYYRRVKSGQPLTREMSQLRDYVMALTRRKA